MSNSNGHHEPSTTSVKIQFHWFEVRWRNSGRRLYTFVGNETLRKFFSMTDSFPLTHTHLEKWLSATSPEWLIRFANGKRSSEEQRRHLSSLISWRCFDYGSTLLGCLLITSSSGQWSITVERSKQFLICWNTSMNNRSHSPNTINSICRNDRPSWNTWKHLWTNVSFLLMLKPWRFSVIMTRSSETVGKERRGSMLGVQFSSRDRCSREMALCGISAKCACETQTICRSRNAYRHPWSRSASSNHRRTNGSISGEKYLQLPVRQ